MMSKQPIGVIDSGIGGLTVVRELQRLLPGEDILYYGDSANCPYGNRSADEIFALSQQMLLRFEGRVRCAAIACNTISAMTERLRPCFDFPLVNIVECAAEEVARGGFSCVGLAGTAFTVASGQYEALIHRRNPDCRVIGKGSPRLAGLIDRGDFERGEIDAEIRAQVGDILARGPVERLILGCTHYPIVEEHFRRCYPALPLLDPARAQAEAVAALLRTEPDAAPEGRLLIVTSGETAPYAAAVERLKLCRVDEIRADSF